MDNNTSFILGFMLAVKKAYTGYYYKDMVVRRVYDYLVAQLVSLTDGGTAVAFYDLNPYAASDDLLLPADLAMTDDATITLV